MTLSKDAIKHIQDTAHIPELIKQLNSHETTEPMIVLPEGFKTESLEREMEFRSSYRFNFKTSVINDFISYCKDFKTDGASCFVNAKQMTAQTIFDLGSIEQPGHQRHRSYISLDETVAYLKLLNIDGDVFSQKDASDFIEDWSELVTITAKSDSILTAIEAARGFRGITIDMAKQVKSEVGDFSQNLDTMESIEAKHQYNIPHTIDFKCVPFLHFKERTFRIRVSMLTSGDVPKFVFRVVKLESIKENIAEEFKSILTAAFKSIKEMKTYLGSER